MSSTSKSETKPRFRLLRRRAGPADPRAISEGALTDTDRARFPALAVALHPGPPSFEAVALSRIYGRKDDDPAVQEAMRRYHPALLTAFAERFGSGPYHWCAHAKAAATLTRRSLSHGGTQRLWLLFNPTGHWRAGEVLLDDCINLNQAIEYHLRGRSRIRDQKQLYELVTRTLSVLDEREGQSVVDALTPEDQALVGQTVQDDLPQARRRPLPDPDAEYGRRTLESIRSQVQRDAKRTLQLRYILGMSLATLLAAAVLVPALLHGTSMGLVSAAAGAAGATVSTLVRMSDKRGLELDLELSPGESLLLGTFRTLLGLAFGVVLCLLLRSGLVSVAPQNGNVTDFYAALAFVAGFSERLVPDTLGVVGAMVASKPSAAGSTQAAVTTRHSDSHE
jgi:hypothetical protein